jgi:hypothetical protein
VRLDRRSAGSPSRTNPQMSRSKSSAVMPGTLSNRPRSRSRFMAGRPRKWAVIRLSAPTGTASSPGPRIPKSKYASRAPASMGAPQKLQHIGESTSGVASPMFAVDQ